MIRGLTTCFACIAVLLSIPATAQTNFDRQADYLDCNNIKFWLSTFGMTAHDPSTDTSGCEFPRGSQKYLEYTEGMVWAGMVEGELRAGGATYRYGMQQGPILSNGSAANTTDPKYRLYKVQRILATEYTQLSTEQQITLRKDYTEWPVDNGAPWVDTDADGIYEPDFDSWLTGSPSGDYPMFDGDQAFWCVSNDLNHMRTNFLYGTSPVGLELHTMMWAYSAPGVYQNTIFMKYTLINKGTKNYTDVFFSKFSDVDVGDPYDDCVGVDTTAQIAYAYNGSDYDNAYGSAPPAVGHILLQGPMVPSPGNTGKQFGTVWENYRNLPASSFIAYTGDTLTGSADPSSPGLMMYYTLQGLYTDNSPILNPINNNTTTYMFPGDPITKQGWIDGVTTIPGQRKYYLTTGPFDLNKGDTTEIVFALVAAQGTDRFNSVEQLLQDAHTLYSKYNSSTTDVASAPQLPQQLALSSAYPNPATQGVSSVNFTIPEREYVTLRLTNALGQTVAITQDGMLEPGTYQRPFYTTGLPAGMYFYTLTASSGSITKRILIQ